MCHRYTDIDTTLAAIVTCHARLDRSSHRVTAGARAAAVNEYARPNRSRANDGGWVGLCSRPPWWSIVAGHGPSATAAITSTQHVVANAARARPVGRRPSCHAKPAIWKPSHPMT